MAQIADLTYNVAAFTEIINLIWKRLNDEGKNWRHVYKALILLEYLIKTGTEKVAQQCKHNIFPIKMLQDFQYFEEGKDYGKHVREKAKKIFSLLKNDEDLRNERAKALKTKEKFAQNVSGFGYNGSNMDLKHHNQLEYDPPVWASKEEATCTTQDSEFVRPQTVGEEEMQLELAIAMSCKEAQQNEEECRNDDIRLQLAIRQSQKDFM